MVKKLTRYIEKIYTDGACSGNPGPGGWGVVCYLSDGQVHELGGAARETTNNRMELQAAIAALQFLNQHPQSKPVSLFTDSEYVKKGATQWMAGWKRRGWKTAQGKPVLNQDLWMELEAANPKAVERFYVKGHAGNPGNERCDEIARGFSLNSPPELTQVAWQTVVTAAQEQVEQPPQEQDQGKKNQPREETESSVSLDAPSTPKASNIPKAAIIQEQNAFNPSQNLDGTSSDEDSRSRHLKLQALMEILRCADEIAQKGYLLSSQELSELLQLSPKELEKSQESWVWRNWRICQVRQAQGHSWWRLETQN